MANITAQGLLQEHLGDVLQHHRFPLYQVKALRKLSVCRTEQLGAHVQYCEAGHLNGVWYNSCKNRSCPQCQGIAREEWLQNTQRCLLDCPHHHVIFTIPQALNDLWRYNRAAMSDLLFKSVNDTLKKFAKNPEYLGAVPGLLMALHTWGRNLSLHPHIHCVISHGGQDTEGNWVEPKKKVLFPQKPVMMVFRGCLLANIKKSVASKAIDLPPDVDGCAVETLLNKLGRQDWVVHFCTRYEHSRGVAKYLSRYIRGGPFSNRQLKLIKGNKIKFRYTSHHTKRKETLVLSVGDFVVRMAQHIALPNKPSVRYGGLYSASLRPRLNAARKRLGQRPVSPRELIGWQEFLASHDALPVCKECGLLLVPLRREDREEERV